MPDFGESERQELFRMLTSSTWAKFMSILLESANRHRKNILSGTLDDDRYRTELARLRTLRDLLVNTYGEARTKVPPTILSIFE